MDTSPKSNSNRSYPFWPYPLDSEKPRNENEVKFWSVHALYPEIYVRVDNLCWQLIGQGVQHYSSDAFFHRLRWHSGTTMDPPEPWKMNNIYTAYYARYWLQNNEIHWGFFELRRVKGEYPYKPPPPPWKFDPDGHGLLF